MNNQQSQDIFAAIAQFAALCATTGVDEETIKAANVEIRKLITLLSPQFDKLSLNNKGILV